PARQIAARAPLCKASENSLFSPHGLPNSKNGRNAFLSCGSDPVPAWARMLPFYGPTAPGTEVALNGVLYSGAKQAFPNLLDILLHGTKKTVILVRKTANSERPNGFFRSLRGTIGGDARDCWFAR